MKRYLYAYIALCYMIQSYKQNLYSRINSYQFFIPTSLISSKLIQKSEEFRHLKFEHIFFMFQNELAKVFILLHHSQNEFFPAFYFSQAKTLASFYGFLIFQFRFVKRLEKIKSVVSLLLKRNEKAQTLNVNIIYNT